MTLQKVYGAVIAIVGIGLTAAFFTGAAAQSNTPAGIKNVVLVHGAFADGSGWEAVANILKKDGYTVSVVQHPETSYAEDIKFTKAVIDRQSGPVVLVGHSYGGAVITQAGNDPKVAALVYIAAFSAAVRLFLLPTVVPCPCRNDAIRPLVTNKQVPVIRFK